MYRQLKQSACRSKFRQGFPSGGIASQAATDDIDRLLRVMLRCARRPLRCMTSIHKYRRDLNPATADTTRRACVASRVRSSLHALIIPDYKRFPMANSGSTRFLHRLKATVSSGVLL